LNRGPPRAREEFLQETANAEGLMISDLADLGKGPPHAREGIVQAILRNRRKRHGMTPMD
jgi:hypothetical protein